MCDHNHHIGLGEPADQRFAAVTWMQSPDEKANIIVMFQQALGLLHEYDELRLPPRDAIELAALNDVRTRVANWICGEGEWEAGT